MLDVSKILEKVLDKAPDIIRESSKTLLGTFSLIILCLSVIAGFFFWSAPVEIRVLIYFAILISAVLYGAAIVTLYIRQGTNNNASTPGVNAFFVYKVLAVLFLILLIAGSVVWDLFFRSQIVYYKSTARKFRHWTGIDPVDSNAASHMNKVYKFVYKGRLGKLEQVQIINGQGQCPTDGMEIIMGLPYSQECSEKRACKAQFEYDDSNVVLQESIYDHLNKPLYNLRYTSNSDIAQFEDVTAGSCPLSKTGVTYVRFIRFETGAQKGFDKETYFLAEKKSPEQIAVKEHRNLAHQPNEKGHFGSWVERDNQGRIEKLQWLDENLKPTGIMEERLYDVGGNLNSTTYYDVDRHAAYSKDGCSKNTYNYNSFGNLIKWSCFDQSGGLAASAQGFAEYKKEYDDNGNNIGESYYHADGKPYLFEGYARYSAKVDQQGNRIETRMFNAKDELDLNDQGYAIRRAEFDVHGQKTSDMFFDKQNKPTNNIDGYAKLAQIFDDNGYKTSISFYEYDREKKAYKETNSKDGFQTHAMIFDEKGRRSAERYYDLYNKPTSYKGAISIKYEYDQNGNQTKSIYLDEHGDKIASDDGCAILKYQNDYKGHLVRIDCYDQKENPILDKDGVFRWEFVKDRTGADSSAKYFDTQNKTAYSSFGYAGMLYDYDPINGYLKKISYLDSEQRLMEGKKGYASFVKTYGRIGKVIQEDFLDAAGNLTLNSDGYARIELDYDGRGNITEYRYRDVKNNLTTKKGEKYSIKRQLYDERGKLLTKTFHDQQGRPSYDGEGISQYVYTYNEKGTTASVSTFGTDSTLKLNKTGYSVQKNSYDDKGRIVEERFYNDQKPVKNKSGCETVRYGYNAKWQKERQQCLDEQGRLIKGKNGWAEMRWAYNEFGDEVEKSFFDISGHPCKSSKGREKVAFVYDKMYRRLVEERSADPADHLINNKDGYARVIYAYDVRGWKVEERYLDKNGNPAINKEQGCWRKVWSYEKNGKVRNETSYDKKNNIIKVAR